MEDNKNEYTTDEAVDYIKNKGITKFRLTDTFFPPVGYEQIDKGEELWFGVNNNGNISSFDRWTENKNHWRTDDYSWDIDWHLLYNGKLELVEYNKNTMKYNINNLPDKVKVVKENDIWVVNDVLKVESRESEVECIGSRDRVYLGLEAGILEPYDDEQEKLREEIFEKIEKCENVLWIDAARKVLKGYKITKI